MSEKMYKIILKVDLHCNDCNKKIKRTLCKLQDREQIQSVMYDEKNNTVTITGPFDPNKLLKKICCKARKVIIDIQIVGTGTPETDQETPKVVELDVKLPQLDVKLPELVVKLPEKLPELVVKLPEKLPELVVKLPEPVVKPYPYPVPYPYPYLVPAWTPGSGACCCRPRFEAYYGSCRCCSCGWIYGPVSKCPPTPPPTSNCPPPLPLPPPPPTSNCPPPLPPPPPTYVYGYGGQCCDGQRTCEFLCEEQPATCQIT